MTGWKDWTVGEVVTEPDFQSYIQNQVVQNYASSTARSSALGTVVAEGMVSYLQDTNLVEVYDGSAWVAVGAGDITAVTAGTGLTGGGTAGSVTLNADYAAIGSAITITAAQISDLTATAAELNYVDGVTSAIQTQLNAKLGTSNASVSTATAGSAVVRNVTLSTAVPGTATGGIDGDVWLVYTP